MRRVAYPGAAFWWGFALGLAFAFTAVLGLAGYLLIRGITVEVPAARLRGLVGEQIRAVAAAELPELMEETRRQVPQMVAMEMAGRVGSASLQIAGWNLELPPEATRQLENYLQGFVESAILDILNRMDLVAMANRLGDRAGVLVEEGLRQNLKKIKFYWRPGWYSVPLPVSFVVR